MADVAIGTRIYYTGDMANLEGFGTVTDRKEDPRFAAQVEVTMDDGRKLWIYPIGIADRYEGHGGTRFVTEAAYREWKAARLRRMVAEFPG